MSVGVPLGLLALLAAPAVIAAYFLRRKQPPRRVSALFLWRTPDQRAEAGPRFERFSREASLALELLAVCCAALFLADVRCGETAQRAHLVIVVDGSLSMNAVVSDRPVADRVRTAVAELVRAEGAGALTIVESGPRPRLLAGPQQDVKRALAAMERWTPAQPGHDFSAAFQLARELSTTPKQRVFFFTDGPIGSATTPPEVVGRSLGAQLENLAFLAAQRRDENGVATVTVRVGNFAASPRSAVVRFSAKGVPVQQQTVEVSPGATAIVRVSLPTTEGVEVALPPDVLELDGRVTLLPAPPAELTVRLLDDVGMGTAAVGRALRIIEGVSVVQGEAALVIGGVDAPAAVRLGAKGTLRSYVGPFFSQKSHPLLDDVQLSGVVWTAGENPVGQPLLSAGEAVLLSEGDDGVLHLNLDLSRSNVQRSVAWPVLWGNVVRRARASREGFPRRQVHLGEDVPVVTTAGASWALEGPDGTSRPLLGAGPTTVPPLSPPGRWQLVKDGQRVDALEVLALDAAESDLRSRGAWSVDAAKVEALAALGSDRPRPWPWAALMLALLLLDFWLTARRRA